MWQTFLCIQLRSSKEHNRDPTSFIMLFYLKYQQFWDKQFCILLKSCKEYKPEPKSFEVRILKALTPKNRAKGKFHYPTDGLFSASLKMKIEIFFSFRNCKKWCNKAQNAIISLSFPSYVNWQPPENRLCIGERARREVAWRGLESPQAVVYEWIRLSIVLPYADHLFSMTETLLPCFCSNAAWEMVMCL